MSRIIDEINMTYEADPANYDLTKEYINLEKTVIYKHPELYSKEENEELNDLKILFIDILNGLAFRIPDPVLLSTEIKRICYQLTNHHPLAHLANALLKNKDQNLKLKPELKPVVLNICLEMFKNETIKIFPGKKDLALIDITFENHLPDQLNIPEIIP